MFDGIYSPLTQTFGLGLFGAITDTELSLIENFFAKHNAPVNHEVSPLVDVSLILSLNARGYQPIELSNVLFMPIQRDLHLPAPAQIAIRIIKPGEEKIWAEISAGGWATEGNSLADFMFEFGFISAQSQGGFPFIAEMNGQPISTGMLFIFEDVALLGGTSTIPKTPLPWSPISIVAGKA